jgi:hypothetical protein
MKDRVGGQYGEAGQYEREGGQDEGEGGQGA